MDLKDILSKATNDMLTEETYVEIGLAVNAIVEQKVKIAVEAKENELDDRYEKAITVLMESVDADRTDKLVKLRNQLDKKYTEGLRKVVSKYEAQLNESANQLLAKTTQNISDYLDIYLTESGIVKQINESANNAKAINVLNSLKKILSVDAVAKDEVLRNGLVAGREELNALRKENAELKETAQKLLNESATVKRDNLILEKTKTFNANKKAYVTKLLSDKPVDYIKENFDYISKLYDRTETEHLAKLKESAMASREQVDTAIIEESVNAADIEQIERAADNYIDSYVDMLTK